MKIQWSRVFRQRLLRAAVILVSVTLTLLVAGVQRNIQWTHLAWIERLENLYYDTRLDLSNRFQAEFTNPNHIVIVDIDEKSLQEFGRWPWSRRDLAKLNDRLFDDFAATMVVYDILFEGREMNPVDVIAAASESANQQVSTDFFQTLRQQIDADRIFADSFSGRDVVLALLFHTRLEVAINELPGGIGLNDVDGQPLTQSQIDQLLIAEHQGYTANIPLLTEQALMSGSFAPQVDADGIIRRVPMLFKYGNQVYPSLSLAAFMAYNFVNDLGLTLKPSPQLRDVLEIGTLEVLPGSRISLSSRGEVLVPYKGGRATFPYVSAADILAGRVDPSEYEAAFFFVGTSAVGLSDLRSTPLAQSYPGVEIHATLFDAMLNDTLPSVSTLQDDYTALYALITGLLLATLLPRLGAKGQTLLTLTVMTGGLLINFYFWHVLNIHYSFALVFLLYLAQFLLHLMHGFFSEQGVRMQLHQAFGQYVPAAHITQMLSNPDGYTFDGETKSMSVLFSDIRNFTTISESLSASELKQLLNRYFTPITELIFAHQGTVDKYVGDMVMAFWGAPLDDENHAEHALSCALAMQQKVLEIQEAFLAEGLPKIEVGIGINTGAMNVGDMGSTYRRAYTVLGDSVNLASRLEGLTKFYGVKILVGEATLQSCPDGYFRFIDRIKVKGKQESVDVFEPLAPSVPANASILAVEQIYQEALRAYRAQQWSRASDLFAQLLQQDPQSTKLYSVYLSRIVELRDKELSSDWDGSYQHTTKG